MTPINSLAPKSTRAQPWRSIWPAPVERQDSFRGLGFKKGEIIVADGNAGSFFPHGEWEVEQESSACGAKQCQG